MLIFSIIYNDLRCISLLAGMELSENLFYNETQQNEKLQPLVAEYN